MGEARRTVTPFLPLETPLVYLITGGGGYVGSRLTERLLASGDEGDVVVVQHDLGYSDTGPPSEHVFRVTGDIRNRETVAEAARLGQSLGDVVGVFHLASFGMSGREMVRPSQRIHEINVGGTEIVMDVCAAFNIPSLVYCSTYNVAFEGRPLVAAGSDAAYARSQIDAYSRTKREAEEMVLTTAVTLDDGTPLRRTAIRPAAIYGDGEQRHLPRIVSLVDAGLASFAIGGHDVLCDWVYVDNLVHGLVCALAALEGDDACVADGRAYFVSDDSPVNNFGFLRRVLAASGRDPEAVFWLRIPTRVAWWLAWLIELLHAFVFRVSFGRVDFLPLMTRAEVEKVGVTHWACMEDASRDIGYAPLVSVEEAVARTGASLVPQS